MNKKNWYILFSLIMVFSMVLAACAQPAAEQPAAEEPAEEPAAEEPAEEPAAEEPEEEMGFDWRQVEGEKITVFLSETPMAVAIREHIDEFTEQTGIEVEYLVVAENE